MTSRRYPGAAPFADDDLDRKLLFGREDESARIAASIGGHDHLVVYGGSGTGKTSLLRAGVYERLRARGLWPVEVRFNQPTPRLLDIVNESITRTAERDGVGLRQDGPTAPRDFWELLAGIEVTRLVDTTSGPQQELLTPVLVFDQFEELFTLEWKDDQRAEFIEQFGWVARRNRPRERGGGDGRAPDARLVLVIREDYLGWLEELARRAPGLMGNRFRLTTLDASKAEEAIREPAKFSDPRLDTPTFEYTPEAVTAMIDFLRSREETGTTRRADSIGPPQLQIICQYVEDHLIGNGSGSTVTKTALVGEDGEGLTGILQDFYRRTLGEVPEADRSRVRKLCETGLINRRRRIGVDLGSIEDDFGVTGEVLDGLVESRLLRREERSIGDYYELAHDSLVEPILRHRAEREAEEAEREAAREDEQAEAHQRQRRRWTYAGVAFASLLIGMIAATLWSRAGSDVFAVGDAQEGALAAAGDRVETRFEGAAGQSVTFTLVPEFDASLSLTGPDGDVLASREGETAIGLTKILPESGAYTVTVTREDGDGEAAGYRLLSQWDDVVVVDGPPVDGVIAEGRTGQFVFEGRADQVVTLTMDMGSDDFDGVLRLLNADGDPAAGGEVGLRKSGNAGEPDVVSTVLPDDGAYRVVVRGAFGVDAGGYTLSLRTTDTIEVGQEVPATVGQDGEWAAVAFRGEADQAVALSLASSDADGSVELVAPGPPDEGDRRGSQAEIGDRRGSQTVATLPVDGWYRVWFTAPEAGQYVFSLTEWETPTGETDVFTFDGTAGDVVTITTELPGETVATMEVIDPMSAVVRMTPLVGGRPEATTAILPETGAYRVLVSNYTGPPASYDVQPTLRSPSEFDRLGRDAPAQGSIVRATESGVYWFDGEAGRAVTVDLTSTGAGGELDGILELHGPDGTVLGASDAGGGAGGIETITTVLAADSRYWVVARGYEGSTGGYELKLSDAAPLGDLGEDPAVTGTIARTVDHVYTFDGAAGDEVAVRLEPGRHDGVLTVFGPTGEPLASIDDGGRRVSEVAAVTVDEPGTHWVVVSGDASGGNYWLFFVPPDVVAIDLEASAT